LVLFLTVLLHANFLRGLRVICPNGFSETFPALRLHVGVVVKPAVAITDLHNIERAAAETPLKLLFVIELASACAKRINDFLERSSVGALLQIRLCPFKGLHTVEFIKANKRHTLSHSRGIRNCKSEDLRQACARLLHQILKAVERLNRGGDV